MTTPDPTTWVPDPAISGIQVNMPSGTYQFGYVPDDSRGNWVLQGGNRPELAQGQVWTDTFGEAMDLLLAYHAALTANETTAHDALMSILSPPE